MHLHAGGIVGGDSIAAKFKSHICVIKTLSIKEIPPHFIYEQNLHMQIHRLLFRSFAFNSTCICCSYIYSSDQLAYFN